jgi:hypothetical protein
MLVAGAPFYDIVTPRRFSVGICYVYLRPDATSDFVVSQNLTNPAGVANDRFGTSIAISNSVIYVTAPGWWTITLVCYYS